MTRISSAIMHLNNIFPSEATTGRLGSLEQNAWLAQLMGLPIFGLKTESTFFRILCTIYGVTVMTLMTFLYTGFEMYHLYFHWRSLDTFTHNMCLLLTHVSGFVKLMNLLWRLPDLRKSIEKLKCATKIFVRTPQQHKAFQNHEIENKVLLGMYVSLIGSTAIMGIILLNMFPDDLAGQRFPYCVQLPQWIPFKIQLLYMGVAVMILALQIVAIDYLNISMINQIRYQLQIMVLSFDELKHLVNLTQDGGFLKFYNKLKSIIKHHCLLIEIRDEIESIFGISILLQFFTSLILFGITGFRATVTEGDISKDAIVFLYCGCILGQLSLYCWFGNEVFEKSKLLATESFGTSWYQYDERFRKAFLIFIMNAQRPFLFTASGFMGLSLPTFTGILSKSYTAVALLRQVYGN